MPRINQSSYEKTSRKREFIGAKLIQKLFFTMPYCCVIGWCMEMMLNPSNVVKTTGWQLCQVIGKERNEKIEIFYSVVITITSAILYVRYRRCFAV